MQQQVEERAIVSAQKSTIIATNAGAFGHSGAHISGFVDSELVCAINEDELKEDHQDSGDEKGEHSETLLIIRHHEYYVQRNLPSEKLND